MFTTAYLKSLGERVVVAFAAALAALLTADGFNALDLASWKGALVSALLTAGITLVVSVAGGKATTSNAPAITSKTTEDTLAKPNESPIGL